MLMPGGIPWRTERGLETHRESAENGEPDGKAVFSGPRYVAVYGEASLNVGPHAFSTGSAVDPMRRPKRNRSP